MNPTINFLFDQYSHYLLYINGILSIGVNILAVHVIFTRSPKQMNVYKWLLFHMACALADFLVSVLLAPVPLEKGVGAKMWGILGSLFPNHGRLFCITVDIAIAYVCWANLLCFVYRLYLLTTTQYKWIHKLAFFSHIIRNRYLLLLVALLFLGIIGSILVYLPALSSEDEIRFYAKRELSLVDDSHALWLILPANFQANTNWGLYCLFYIIITYTSFIVITIAAYYILKRIGNITKGHVAQHKMLLKSLIMQTVIPLITVVFPLVLTGLAQKLKQNPESAPYARLCSIPGLIMLSNYSISHVAVMFFYTTPYHRFISKVYLTEERQFFQILNRATCGNVKYEESTVVRSRPQTVTNHNG